MESDEVIRKQWDEAAESWVEFVRSCKDYYREYLNGPALKLMIGDIEGKRVLDIGCEKATSPDSQQRQERRLQVSTLVKL